MRTGHRYLLHSLRRMRLHRHDDKLPRQEVEDTPEDERDERTAHDDHVIRHAEIWGREVHEQCRRIDPVEPPVTSEARGLVWTSVSAILPINAEGHEYRWGQVPAALRIRRVFRIPQERFYDVHRQRHSAICGERDECLQQRGPSMRYGRSVGRYADEIV